jgi:hypothetical protein
MRRIMVPPKKLGKKLDTPSQLRAGCGGVRYLQFSRKLFCLEVSTTKL